MKYILAVIVLFSGVAAPFVSYLSEKKDQIVIAAPALDETLSKCIKSGLELRYVFSIAACRKRSFWLDNCKDERKHISKLSYDPISRSYSVNIDLLGDGKEPLNISLTDESESLAAITKTSPLSIGFIAHGKPEFLSGSSAYLDVRVLGECRSIGVSGEGSAGEILSLGLFDDASYDSGHVEFLLSHTHSK